MLADYYARSAVAASQVLAGFDESAIREQLGKHAVGISIGAGAGRKAESRLLLDMLVRLLARLYPVLVIRSLGKESKLADEAMSLAKRINPNIECASVPSVEVVIGEERPKTGRLPRIFVGSQNGTAYVATTEPCPIGGSRNPLGPGAAACLGAANLFRLVFQSDRSLLDKRACLSTLVGANKRVPVSGDLGEIVLVGAGAIGNGTAWALSHLEMSGTLHLVDHETIELGNLQRYALAERDDEYRSKVEVLKRYFRSGIDAVPHGSRLDEFVAGHGHRWEKMLLALDSARDRRAAQASLPRWVANAWTQPGDLGVSVHDFVHGACVYCLYLPDHALENEDQILASAFGTPDQLIEIRTLLHNGAGASRALLEAIAGARQIPIEKLLPFEGRPVRSLYVEGFCGGAAIPLGGLGAPRQEVHVPLPHQSALAGILLAAACIERATVPQSVGTTVTRVDLMRPLGSFLTQPAAKDPRQICICQDSDYQAAFAKKYATGSQSGSSTGTARVARHETEPGPLGFFGGGRDPNKQ